MLPTAKFRTSPEDFVVDEIPAYAPSGTGEHLHLVIKKTNVTTMEAVKRLSRALDVDPRGAGYAGMKDRHAVSTQAITVPFPIARGDGEAAVAGVSIEGLEVLRARRHINKLKPGHLVGNRFSIVLRGLDDAARASIEAELGVVATRGAPNAFGPQRFGRDGDNPARALAWMAGSERVRDRNEQRLLFSALQSLLFNRVLDRRVAEGTWSTVLPGDVAKKHDSGGIFTVPPEGADLADAVERAAAAGISATGPMFGVKMRWPEGEPLAIERAVFDDAIGDMARLEAVKHAGEGTRRVLRLWATELSVDTVPGGLLVRFVLPKGGYATTVLGCACTLVDGSRVAASETPEADSR